MQKSLVSTGVRNLVETYADLIRNYGVYGNLHGLVDGASVIFLT